MSTSSKADRPPHRGRRGRAGFTLVEALIALVVAGLMLPALARALGGAWSASRAPMDVVSAVALARGVAAGGSVPAEARDRGYTAERASLAATVLVLPSDVAPAPRGTGKDQEASELRPDATPSAIKLTASKGFDGTAQGAAAANVALRRVAVVVRTPAGRRITLDSLRLDDAPR